jgi:hypothetical protein
MTLSHHNGASPNLMMIDCSKLVWSVELVTDVPPYHRADGSEDKHHVEQATENSKVW